MAAAGALRGQSNLPEAIVTSVVARLENEDGEVRGVALEALRGQSNLPETAVKSGGSTPRGRVQRYQKERLADLGRPIEPDRGDRDSPWQHD